MSPYDDMRLVDLVREMKRTEQELEAAEAAAKEVRQRLDELRLKVIPERCETEGVESIRVEGVGTLYLTSDMQVSMIADRRDEAMQWLVDHGLSNLIKDTVNASSLKAALKLEIREGREVPTELFKVYPFTRAAINKS